MQTQIAAAGVNHMILAITDAALVKALMGREIEGVPDVDTQLQLDPRPGDARLRLTSTHRLTLSA